MLLQKGERAVFGGIFIAFGKPFSVFFRDIIFSRVFRSGRRTGKEI